MFAPTVGLLRALDVVAPDYQKGSQDFIAGWNANCGQSPRLPGSRQRPLVHHRRDGRRRDRRSAQTGGPREAPPRRTCQAYNGAGAAASSAWPKLTGGWTVATPALGSLGTDRHEPRAPRRTSSRSRAKARCRSTRTPASACSPSSWPNFHHDIANSGDYTRDAVPPGKPLNRASPKTRCTSRRRATTCSAARDAL